MKKVLMIGLSSGILFFGSCSNNNDKALETKDEKTTEVTTKSAVKENVPSQQNISGSGTYTAEGRTYTGEVTTETNAGLRNLFTVTCKGDMVQMIEMHFKNEEAARKSGSFKPGSLLPGEDNEVGIMFGIGYNSSKAQGGTITVTGSGGKNIIELDNVTLTIPDKSIIVSGKFFF